ncbi:MAG: CpsD/CapB family tyrosine-protein kinase [Eubacterium sp.]|nr:CpsD/CapB family tyrosine-protein kinase [Eubacterium sp.]
MQKDILSTEQYDDEIVIDIQKIIGDYLKFCRKYWFQLLLLFGTVITVVTGYFTYQYSPMYTAKITYAVNKTGDTGIDSTIAKRISGSVSTIVSMKEFKSSFYEFIDEKTMNNNYSITSSYTDGAALFNVAITANNYKNANILMEAFEKFYPEWVAKSNGAIELQMIDKSAANETPDNYYSILISILKGAVLGVSICFMMATLYVITRKTVRSENDMKRITRKNCYSVIPDVKVKKRSKSKRNQLLLTSNRIDWGFKQAIFTAQSRIEKQLAKNNQKVLMVTSTLVNEGKTMVAINLAMAFSHQNKNVLLIDGDLRNPSVGVGLGMPEELGISDYFMGNVELEKCIKYYGNIDVITAGSVKGAITSLMNETFMKQMFDELRNIYDYIIMDSPPAYLFADAGVLSKYADMVTYIVCYDYAPLKEIKEGMQFFIQEEKLEGYLINRNPGGFSTYNKYGYGKYNHYGKYNGKLELKNKTMNTEETL